MNALVALGPSDSGLQVSQVEDEGYWHSKAISVRVPEPERLAQYLMQTAGTHYP